MWEIYAYHNTEALSGIFNAIAAIMASSTYLSAIAAVAFCGFVAAMIAYMFQPEKLQGWKWLMTVVLVYGVLFVPRVTVGIVDKTGGTPNRIIANVPFGMAALGGLTSTIGNTIPGSGLADMMIANYREVVAADYAFTFLNQYLNVALSALMKQHLLNDAQKQIANLQRDDIHKFMTRLQQEQSNMYMKVTSVSTVATDLERLERNLRANMSSHVLDMLGHAHRVR